MIAKLNGFGIGKFVKIQNVGGQQCRDKCKKPRII